MPELRSAVHSARDRGVLPQFRPDGNIRMMARALDLTAPISVRSLIRLLDSLHFDRPPVDGASAPAPPPHISVGSAGSGSGAVFTVQGTGFVGGHDVRVRVVDDQLTQTNFNRSADSGGNLTAEQPIPCISGLMLHFSATDGRTVPPAVDMTGFLWSNTFDIRCP
ncbi:hypothetical protein ACFWFI_07375 [Streptomyces sp. NPDC060209]|uniref:hypothetical protein n=1 Tax=Streptomyces sp. NPDC060209 TaxID=3347073 RepID=UPI0036622131